MLRVFFQGETCLLRKLLSAIGCNACSFTLVNFRLPVGSEAGIGRMGKKTNEELGLNRPPNAFSLWCGFVSTTGVKLPVRVRLRKKTLVNSKGQISSRWHGMSTREKEPFFRAAQTQVAANEKCRLAARLPIARSVAKEPGLET